MFLKSASINASHLKQGCNMSSLEAGRKTGLLHIAVHNICNQCMYQTDTITIQALDQSHIINLVLP